VLSIIIKRTKLFTFFEFSLMSLIISLTSNSVQFSNVFFALFLTFFKHFITILNNIHMILKTFHMLFT